MLRMALAVLLAIGTAAATPAPAPGSKEVFDLYVADTNEKYAKTPTAVLKLDDAIYLNPGERAVLIAAEAAPEVLKFAIVGPTALSPPGAVLMSIGYVDGKGETTIGETTESFSLAQSKLVELSPSTRVRIQEVEIAPGEMGLRAGVYNDANAIAAAFTGIEIYPYNPDFVVAATLVPVAKVEAVTFQTSRGWYKRFYRVADAVMTVKGQEIRLPLYAGAEKMKEIDGLSAFFMDATTGATTYGTGRYMDWSFDPGQFPGTITVNFNEAYNPLCARSPHWNCPVAIDTLPLAVEAGEKKPSKEDHAAAQ
jgi:uncharacterized protein